MTAFSLAELSKEMFATRDRLARNAGGCGVAGGLTRFIDRLGRAIARPPRIVLAGEFNSGKSTLCNTLLGTELLPTSIHANTRVPILVHYSETPTLSYEGNDHRRHAVDLSSVTHLHRATARMLRVGLPVERLKHVELIDTPGLATGSKRVDALVLEAFKRSHMAIWCTVASQAWKATEQAQWTAAPRRLKANSVLAVTHVDAIIGERDRDRLAKRLTIEARPHFASICMIAGEQALACSQSDARTDVGAEASDWRESGGAQLAADVQRSLGRVVADRGFSAQRLLQRTTERLARRSAQQTSSNGRQTANAEREDPILAA